MANWSKDKKDSSEINGGKEFTINDNLAVDELNAMVNNSFYAVDFAEAMADEPDISEIDGDGTPSVSLIDNEKNGKVLKKLKFSNLKGARGEQGEQGNGISYIEKADSPDGIVDGYRIHFDNGEYFDYEVTNGNGIKSIQQVSTSLPLLKIYEITLDDLTTSQIRVYDGKGINTIFKSSTEGLVDTYTIAYNNSTTETFTITNGEKGEKGDTNALTIGSVTSGDTASATITGTSPNQVLNLVLPKGDKGDKGDVGVTFTYDSSTYKLTITT